MKLNRTKLNQMIDREMNIGGRRSGGSGGGSGGGVSQQWVEENYISKAFFTHLFTVHSTTSGTDVEPNDVDTAVGSIEALFGLYSEKFISALGENSSGGGGGSTTLGGLLDVTLSSPTNGQVLTYNSASGKWINQNPQSGGASSLSQLSDVNIGVLADGQVLKYSQTAGKWINSSISVSVGMSDLTDVSISSLVNNQVLVYNGTSGKWTNQTNLPGTWWGRSMSNGAVTGIIEKTSGIKIDSAGTGYGGYVYFYFGGGATLTSKIEESSSGTLSVNDQIYATNNGNVGIGGSPDASTYKLKVTGATQTTTTMTVGTSLSVGTNATLGSANGTYIQIGGIRLRYDNSNNCLWVETAGGSNASLFARGSVTALA